MPSRCPSSQSKGGAHCGGFRSPPRRRWEPSRCTPEVSSQTTVGCVCTAAAASTCRASPKPMGWEAPSRHPPGAIVVGHDVIGGLFAIDGGALGVAPGQVCYFGPDTLTWDGLGGGYSAFLLAALGGGWMWCLRGCDGRAGRTRWRPWNCRRAFSSTLRHPASRAVT